MPVRNFEDLFIDELKDIYDAERRITKALPKMIRNASSPELSSALEEHLQVTEEQIGRLDRIFEEMGKSPGRKTCDGMVGLLEEGQKIMEEAGPEHLTDAGIIAAAQKVEHYEIATYGTLRDWAKLLGRDEVARMLQETLDEEGEADKKLTKIAQSLNVEAAEEGEEQEEDEGAMVHVRRGNGGSSRGNGGRSRSSRSR
jgi:ferritin-like metal-binding protein YciE